MAEVRSQKSEVRSKRLFCLLSSVFCLLFFGGKSCLVDVPRKKERLPPIPDTGAAW